MPNEQYLDTNGLNTFWNQSKNYTDNKLSEKQDTLSNGDGTTVVQNKVNVNSPVQGIKTQAEFDALPSDDQNKGFWVINDNSVGSNDYVTVEQLKAALAEIKTEEVYSTEETRIGTWIDGKPLYRKCYIITTGTISTNANTILTYDETFECKDFDFTIRNSDGSAFKNSVFLSDSTWQFSTYIELPIREIRIWVGSSIAPKLSNCDANLRLEYTKTTDEVIT